MFGVRKGVVSLQDTMPPPPLAPQKSASEEMLEMRRRADDLSTECNAARRKLETLRKRTTSFVNTAELEASRDTDAAEITSLERENEGVIASLRETYERRKTYEQIIKRLKEEGTTYWRELGQIDHTSKAKEHDFRLLGQKRIVMIPGAQSCDDA